MSIRRITSLTALISFLFILLTSTILYIVPQGRVAYWSDWHLMGLSKTEWGNIHINLGFLFILSILLHIYYNWKPILNYMKDRQKNLKIFTINFNAALIITLLAAVGTFFMVPPFSSIIAMGDKIKDNAALKYGEPPFGHAEEAPLNSLIKKMGLNFKESIAKLETSGIKIDAPDQVFLEIAKKHNMTSKEVYDIIKPVESSSDKRKIPAIPKPGTGKKTFLQLCSDFQLNADEIIKDLELKGMVIEKDKSIIALASMNNKTSIQLYNMIKEISEREGK